MEDHLLRRNEGAEWFPAESQQDTVPSRAGIVHRPAHATRADCLG